ncbi:MAG: hypothetical protein EA376_01695 [Phycisphaeraceae bacterium]|nr:MAG: hypothetical protein EA376_01695 [Phycisphaeraceae bacterium]
MSEYAQPAGAPPARTENGLGIAGFICSLLGVVSCGLLSPVGLILSIVAMFREPKGFAIAGLVLGLVGSVWMLMLTLVVASIGFAVIAAVFAAGFSLKPLEAWVDGTQITEAVIQHINQHGDAPDALTELANLSSDTLIDPWGNRYRFEVIDGGARLRLISDGPDGLPDTDDDLELEFPLRR